MKIAAQHKATHNVHLGAPLRPAPMQRSHTDHLDSFHRQSQQRPHYRRSHSAPRVPLAHARAKPEMLSAVDMSDTPKVSASCANTTGASFVGKLRAFAGKALDATLVFALWLVDLFIEVGMDRVGQHFHGDKSATSI